MSTRYLRKTTGSSLLLITVLVALTCIGSIFGVFPPIQNISNLSSFGSYPFLALLIITIPFLHYYSKTRILLKSNFIFQSAVGNDIKNTEKFNRINDLEKLYQHVLQNPQNVIYTVNIDGIITDMNDDAIKQELGYGSEYFIGTHYLDWVHNEDKPIISKLLFKTDPDELNFSFRLVMTPDEILHINAQSFPIFDDHNDLQGKLVIATNISKELLIHDRLAASEEKYSELYNNVQVGLITLNHPDLNIATVNDKAAMIFGYHSTELLGLPASALRLKPDAKRELLPILEEKGSIAGYPMQMVRDDNSLRDLQVYARLNPQTDKIEMNLIDITEQKTAENKLGFQAYLLENVQESIVVMNLDGNIVYSNEKAKKIFHIADDSKPINEVTLPFNQDSLDKILKCLLAGEIWEDESTISIYGLERTFLHRFHPLHNDNTLQIVIISTDISELTEARTHAETANMAKSQFLANMTHELRTPMIGIMGSLDLLEQSHLDQEQMENVYIIQECSKQLLDIINEILDVSKIDLGIEHLNPSATELHHLLYKTTGILEAMFRDKGLLLELFIDPHLPEIVMLDQLKLRQVMVNLLYNAVKFTLKGGIKIKALLEQSSPESKWLFVTVADTGIGIAQDKLASIFDRFSQADNSTCREYGGTGLGLYICKKHIELMGGEIWVESQEGRGSVFSFCIPLIPVVNQNADEARPSIPSLVDDLGCEFLPISILVVEDNELNQKLVSQMLTNYGFVVTTVANGLECLNIIQYKDFDVILMDMQMPVMDGYEATTAIRQNHDWDHIPVIAITANAMSGDKEKCLSSGCSSYLAKPFKAEELIQEIKYHLKANFINKKKYTSSSNQLIVDLIPEFIELMGEMLVDLEQAIKSKDLNLIQNIGHSIKGTAGMYGFMNMSDLAACIEQSARDKALSKLPKLFSQLSVLYQQVSKPMYSEVIG